MIHKGFPQTGQCQNGLTRAGCFPEILRDGAQTGTNPQRLAVLLPNKIGNIAFGVLSEICFVIGLCLKRPNNPVGAVRFIDDAELCADLRAQSPDSGCGLCLLAEAKSFAFFSIIAGGADAVGAPRGFDQDGVAGCSSELGLGFTARILGSDL